MACQGVLAGEVENHWRKQNENIMPCYHCAGCCWWCNGVGWCFPCTL